MSIESSNKKEAEEFSELIARRLIEEYARLSKEQKFNQETINEMIRQLRIYAEAITCLIFGGEHVDNILLKAYKK